jgi:hypothetical protein
VEGCGLTASGSGQRPVAGCSENGNEPSGSLKCVKFDYLSDYKFLKMGFALWI